ncbi:hypothetical protein [Rubrimonas sp.]|uniref:hypothetical protein n=1 Tax=Rubrimonas sp. TaxID=2036015 RepID=UPI002FDE5692
MAGQLFLDAMAALGDEVQVVVVGSPHHDRESGAWMVRVSVRVTGEERLRGVTLPIGALPLLSAGRVFSKGRRLDLVRVGAFQTLMFPNLAECEEIGSDSLPSALLEVLGAPPGARRGEPQTILRYSVDDRTILVPAVELARALYFRHSVLAQAVFRPQGLMELCVHPMPGRHEAVHLDFTATMPVDLLRGRSGMRFAELFGWIAIDPAARQGWDSIGRLTTGGRALRLSPPEIQDSRCRVSAIEVDDTLMVLEFLTIGRGVHPCGAITFSHPKLVRPVRFVPAEASASDRGDDPGEPVDGDPQGRRRRVDPATTLTVATQGAPGAGSRLAPVFVQGDEFDERIPVRAIRPDRPGASGARVPDASQDESDRARRPEAVDGAGPMAAQGAQYTPAEQEGPRQQDNQRIITFDEPGPDAKLPKLEFKLLEPMPTDWTGELELLIAVLKRVQQKLPDGAVASALTPLPDGRSISRVGDARLERRPALIALLRPPGAHPRALIDVDHSDQVALAMLALRYRVDPTLQEIEADVAALLAAMMKRGGVWDRTALDARKDAGALVVERMPKVLRKTDAGNLKAYLDQWALKLIKRLDLVRHMN